MNCGLFGVRFSVLWHKKGAIAPVDYLSTFATAPFDNLDNEYITYFLRIVESFQTSQPTLTN